MSNGDDNGKWYEKAIKTTEFIHSLKRHMGHADVRYVLFLGAGCSKSSGIPTADELVYRWLKQLKGDDDPGKSLDEWAKENVEGYERANPAKSYGTVFKMAYHTPELRQQEIERICEKAQPQIGYVVLARLITDNDGYKGKMNIVFTTNFDDLVAESTYLFTDQKLRMFVHESLFEHMRLDSPMPTVCKLHGDAHIETRNTPEETEALMKSAEDIVRTGLRGKGVIFIGYGGNDGSIAKIFSGLTAHDFPWGVYWVNSREPGEKLRSVLSKIGNVVWVKHTDFDALMIRFQETLGIDLPDEDEYLKRFNDFKESHKKTIEKVDEDAREIKEPEERAALENAVRHIAKEFDAWWAVELEARKYKKEDSDKANKIYSDGIDQFPESHELLGNYAVFLKNVRKDYDRAEEYYKRSLEADPDDANYLVNYAIFLQNVRKDYDRAEEYYKRALEADPDHANNLVNYAVFLENVRKDYDRAEEYYKRALEADPDSANKRGQLR